MTTFQAPRAALTTLWRELALAETALDYVELLGAEPALPSSFAVGTVAQVSIGAAALAAAELWKVRGGKRQRVRVPMRHAALEFRSERYLRLDQQPLPEIWDKIAGVYRCGDGRWVRLHTNFPHHRDGVLALLGCAYDKDAVAHALEKWRAEEFEDAASERGLCVAMARTFAEWDEHEQGRAVAAGSLFNHHPIGLAPPKDYGRSPRPLGGIRVLDLTRIIAGPVCARALAAHGADVLHVTSPHLPSIMPLVLDTGRGKRSCYLDLKTTGGRSTLESLVREADVFIQGYRPGSLSALGFGPERVAELSPGIVYVSLSAYGSAGPWASRRGFDSLVQMASGINWAEAEAAEGSPQPQRPRPLPAQALDHSAGYLMALATCVALMRQAEQGQSWHVELSLARCGHWLRSLGREPAGLAAADPPFADVRDVIERSASGFGSLEAVRHAAQMERTAARWELPSVPLGSDAPIWR